MNDTAIQVEHLSKEYKISIAKKRHDTLHDELINIWQNLFHYRKQNASRCIVNALENVSFHVHRGETVGIIGKNGAGKSTLLKILSRITEPTSGEVRIYGRVAGLLEVGTGFHPDLTGRENVYMNGALLGMTRNEINRKFEEIVDFSGIEKFIDTPVKRYSSGMYLRLAFSVAAHLEPEILFVDEVLAVGDASFQKKCLGKMDEVSKQGRTVLFVSHQLPMIKTLCRRVLLLQDGKLSMDGPASQVVDHYLHLMGNDANLLDYAELPEDPALELMLLRAEICKPGGERGCSYDVFDPIELRIEYLVRKPVQGVAITFNVERNGEILFLSHDSDAQPELLGRRSSGTYETCVRLPTPLKAGNYAINLAIGRLMVSAVQVWDGALRFVVEDRSFDTSMCSYSSRRPGVMAAHLAWNTKIVNQKEHIKS
jgi:lipopolysaccharide transport system ATP-binding protein